jgi:hypothetical protein
MTPRPASTGELATLLALLDEAYDKRAWHGPTLRGALRGVTAAAAARRPGPGRHNVWELAVHCAYWKYAVRRRLTGEKRGRFPLVGSNWFPRPEVASERTWKADLELLASEHRRLREAVASLPAAALDGSAAGRRRAHMIRGIAAHDLYHAGQVSLTRRVVR